MRCSRELRDSKIFHNACAHQCFDCQASADGHVASVGKINQNQSKTKTVLLHVVGAPRRRCGGRGCDLRPRGHSAVPGGAEPRFPGSGAAVRAAVGGDGPVSAAAGAVGNVGRGFSARVFPSSHRRGLLRWLRVLSFPECGCLLFNAERSLSFWSQLRCMRRGSALSSFF